MKKLSTNEIRQIWLDFFSNNDHYIMESQSLIPVNDSSLLWINSGVATLKNYFSGKMNPPHVNLTNSQRCIRTNDIFNVGVTSRHQTFFEMLGNFSIGGYFKEHAISLAFELLTKKFAFPLNKLYITVYQEDDVAYKKWIDLGIDKSHIIKCDRDRNFWDVGSGPCGPCTEIYYDRGKKFDPNKIGEKLFFEDIENDRYVEIWNIVFSEFNNDGNNNYTPLIRKNIDTGAGLERLACVLQDVPTNFDTDVFQIIIKAISSKTNFKYDSDAYFSNNLEQNKTNIAFKVIADHMRAIVFAISDGAIPSNKDRGYILRRLIRRIVVMNHRLNINENIFPDLVNSVIAAMKDYYPYIEDHKQKVIDVLEKEYVIFKKTLAQGLKLFNEAVQNKKLDKHTVFKLVETYGFPIELISELAQDHDLKIDIDGFNELFKKHQLISNGQKNVKSMAQQNGALIKLELLSKFHYDQSELDAKVIKLYDDDFNEVNQLKNQNGYVVFDNTCFYATSGGQLHDTGLINNEYLVDDVIKGPNLQHVHHVIDATIKLNDTCHLAIDEHRRSLLMKNHSVEHLIHAVLTKVIDKNIKQEGAFKSPEKVSFDFQYHRKLEPSEVQKIEDSINNIIKKAIKVNVLEMSLEEAQQLGAKAYFEDVYKKIKGKLRVIQMGDESCELCGGTHVNNTNDIEAFKIISYAPKGAGSWRVEGITSFETISNYVNNKINELQDEFNKINQEYHSFQIKDAQFEKDLKQIHFDKDDLNHLMQLMNNVKDQFSIIKVKEMKTQSVKQIEDVKTIASKNINNEHVLIMCEEIDNKNVFNALSELINEHQDKIFVAINAVDGKSQYFLATNEKHAKEKNINLNVVIKEFNTTFNGKGGGKPNFVQGGTTIKINQDDIDQILKKLKN